MTNNPSPNPPASSTPASSTEFPPSEGWPDYPGFGSKEDVLAQMKLLDWLLAQIGVTIHPRSAIMFLRPMAESLALARIGTNWTGAWTQRSPNYETHG